VAAAWLIRRHFFVTFALLVAACAPARVELAPASPVILAVATWNTNAGRGDLSRLIADLRSGRLTGTAPRDIVVLLQEASGREQTTLFSYFTPVRLDGRGNAILSTRPLLEPRAIALPAVRQPRGAVAAAIEVGGRRLFVASAHLENRMSWLKGGPLNDAARGRQAEALVRALPAGEAGILGGDMNSWLREREPAWRAFMRRFDDTPRSRLRATFRDRAALDHLFFDLPQGWRASRRVLEDDYGSDHHPVVGVIF
jgi:endonuclease/exonuclease/phosphatase (EEP) superfamily protein YafD